MTAEDVAASLRRVSAEETGSPLASRLSAVTSVEATDEHTVVLGLGAPSAPLLSSLATIAIVPAEFESDIESLQQKPVGTGPFRLDAWQPNVAVRLVAHDGYWRDGLPKLDGVNFNIVPEAATRQVGLSGGQYHMLPNIDAPAALQLQGRPGMEIVETLELAYSLIGMNVTKAPLDVPAVREAINYAIDRDQIVEAALFGAGQPGGPLSPALESYALDTSSFECFESDPDKARSLLKEAGIETPVELGLLVLPRDDTKAIAQVVQQQLAAVGIELTRSDYVEGARSIGASDARIMFRHVLPNLASVILVQTSLLLSSAILVEASLSFLGLGTQPPTPSLGMMLSEGRNFLFLAPWPAVFSRLAILVVAFALNLFGDALRDDLDPRLRGSA